MQIWEMNRYGVVAQSAEVDMNKYVVIYESEEGERGSLGTGTGFVEVEEVFELMRDSSAKRKVKKEYGTKGVKLFRLAQIELE